LERVYLEREIKDVSYDSYSFLDGLNFVFAVSVPADADRSIETIIVTVEHGTTLQKVPLMILFDSNQPQATPECDNCTQS
jgi:YbbR domain-containing protein